MTQQATSLMQETTKFKQCMYHIKNADDIGAYCCQGSEDHPPGQHVLPLPSPGKQIKTHGSWYPTFEEVVRFNR